MIPMFIVYQNGKEIVPLHHAYTMYGKIMHFSPEDGHANSLAAYPTEEEAEERFGNMINHLEAGVNVYRFPQPRTAPSEPPKPQP
jgi:hypothetical protein